MRPAAVAPLLLALTVCLLSAGCRERTPSSRPDAPASAPREDTSGFKSDAYPWPRTAPTYEPLAARFPAPRGYRRVSAATGSYEWWLRGLPLRPLGSPIRSPQGEVLIAGDSPWLAAVVDLDERRIQECADTVMRLRAEYLRWAGRADEFLIPYSGGHLAWSEWRRGSRVRQVSGRLVKSRSAGPDASRASFDRYLTTVFAWCGTGDLYGWAKPRPLGEARPGDFLSHPGNPGHTAMLADVAVNERGERVALVLEGFLPAQSAHVLRAPDGSGWFKLEPGQPVQLTRWGAFAPTELRSFPAAGSRRRAGR